MQAKSLNADECQDLKKQGLEAMSLLTHASYEINMQRRLLLRPDIGREYSALCSSQLPFTDFLFGDDLQKHLKDIGDQNKIGAKITPNYKGHRLQKDLAITAIMAISSQKTGEATTSNLGNPRTMPTGTRQPGQANRTLAASY